MFAEFYGEDDRTTTKAVSSIWVRPVNMWLSSMHLYDKKFVVLMAIWKWKFVLKIILAPFFCSTKSVSYDWPDIFRHSVAIVWCLSDVSILSVLCIPCRCHFVLFEQNTRRYCCEVKRSTGERSCDAWEHRRAKVQVMVCSLSLACTCIYLPWFDKCILHLIIWIETWA